MACVSALVALSAAACGPYYVQPTDFNVYKLKADSVCPDDYQRNQASMQAWARLGNGSFSVADVSQAMSMSVNALKYPNGKSPNAFVRWLTTHPAERNCLVLAKQCECVREEMNDPWYYPATDGDTHMLAEDLLDKALSHAPTEVQGRYVLIAVRTMMSQHHYDRCLEYWDTVSDKVNCPEVKAMIDPYIIGCRFHTGDREKALRDFIRIGDAHSAQDCAKRMGVDLLDYARLNPDLPFFKKYLSDYLDRIQQLYHQRDYEWIGGLPLDKMKQDRDNCIAAARVTHGDCAAMWYYVATAIADCMDQQHTALNLCNQALAVAKDSKMCEKIKIARFHLLACTMPVGNSYNRMLRQNVRMLANLTNRDIEQFKKFIATVEINDIDDIICMQLGPKPFLTQYEIYFEAPGYYWANMLHRIVVGEAVPRLIKSGRTTQALMYANMGENYLCHLMGADSLMMCWTTSTFQIADSLPTNAVVAYRKAVQRPRGNFEKWLVGNGNNNGDFWNELLGTHYLRDMRYGKAVECLRKVSHSFQQSMNIYEYLNYDPFSTNNRTLNSALDAKLHFAQTMCQLQRQAKVRDRNKRADAMMKMSVALENTSVWIDGGFSVESPLCWALLEYEVSSREMPDYSQMQRLGENMRRKALAMITDRELAAKWAYQLHAYRDVINKYPGTRMAQFVLSHCDNLRDYYIKCRMKRV